MTIPVSTHVAHESAPLTAAYNKVSWGAIFSGGAIALAAGWFGGSFGTKRKVVAVTHRV